MADTHIILWAAYAPAKLSQAVTEILANPTNTVYASAVSAIEITTKFRKGKLPGAKRVAEDFVGSMLVLGFVHLAITATDAAHAGLLDADRSDPWDRILAAQAKRRHMPMLSIDEQLDRFGILRIW